MVFILSIYKRVKYFYKSWKLGIHLIFITKRFGVNNKWWNEYDSIFGWSNKKILYSILTVKPIIDNYKMMKLRAGSMAHFLTDEEYELVFGEEK